LARAGRGRHGFTLIELIVVILIILILVVVLLVALIAARNRGRKSSTLELFDAVNSAIPRWRDGTGATSQSFPSSGPKPSNSGVEKYAGNRLLYRELVVKPKAAGREPYIKIRQELIGYLSATGEVSLTGEEKDAVFIDGWGQPIAYFEWHGPSLRANSGGSDIPGSSEATKGAPVPAWALNKGSYDLYSSGPDKVWGTEDDVRAGTDDGKTPLTP